MKRFAILMLAFACGFGVCWVYRDSREAKQAKEDRQASAREFATTIAVTRMLPTEPANATYTPYAYSIDGDVFRITNPPERESDIWTIKLCGGRVWLYATRNP